MYPIIFERYEYFSEGNEIPGFQQNFESLGQEKTPIETHIHEPQCCPPSKLPMGMYVVQYLNPPHTQVPIDIHAFMFYVHHHSKISAKHQCLTVVASF
jgi:hypothetical protein